MSNILNHNRQILQLYLDKEDYWDFHLCIDDLTGGEFQFDTVSDNCLSSYIDTTKDECVEGDKLFSQNEFVWNKAVNNGLLLGNFGYTSVDNGFTKYEKDRITNKEFFEIYTNTKHQIPEGDFRLKLNKVYGNHKIYDYSNDIILWNNQVRAAKLNGGWFQGFFAANDGCDYKILPTDVGVGWNLEFVLNKEEFHNDNTTLNDKYPNNKGIFFYIGTRAENKWWIKYLTDHEFDSCIQETFTEDYTEHDYYQNCGLNTDYFAKDKEQKEENPCDTYVEDGYYEEDLEIDENMGLETDTGYEIYQPNVKRIETDNKFVFFDRTKEGETTETWDEENTKGVIDYVKHPNIGNYFTLFHRGKGGCDVNTIQEIIETQNKQYNVLQDLYRNAFALQIKDDGTIGYKYLIKDCESDKENYKIESEYTLNTVINDKEWYTINVKIIPLIHKDKSAMKALTQNTITDTMRILIYVNGYLVLVSKELPMFNFKLLDDLIEKQEGVPFNISLGGGTQGLAEVVYLNYKQQPQHFLPLEKEFGGSFIGWIKSFKFYTCLLPYQEVVQNYNFMKKNIYL